MLTQNANGDSRIPMWLRVREFAVPPSMIETATARRRVGDWGGACAAAGVDVEFRLRTVARSHGRELAARLRADLRHLAPELLRWHLPRIAPDGLLRPGLTLTLARYDSAEGAAPLHLVVRTAPAWADAGQRIRLALWDGSGAQPRPQRRFRLDLHRHLWDARRAAELRFRSGVDQSPEAETPAAGPDLRALLPAGRRCAVDRWAAEAAILLRAEGRPPGPVTVRLGGRHRLVLDPGGPAHATGFRDGNAPANAAALPVLPDAATWALPDLELLRTGAIGFDRLHPLIASALAPDHPPTNPAGEPEPTGELRLLDCRGARHRIGPVDGVLAALDHDPDELRREELLAALGGTPLPCLQAIDRAHRRPDCLDGVRERLDHGDTAGALAVVERLLGPDAVLRSGDLRDELEADLHRRIGYDLFRAGLVGTAAESGPGRVRATRGKKRAPRSYVEHRSHPRHATLR